MVQPADPYRAITDTRTNSMKYLTLLLMMLWSCGAVLASSWQDVSQRRTIRNKSFELTCQAGQLVELKDLITGQTLIATDPRELPSDIPLFGTRRLDLSECEISQQCQADGGPLHVKLLSKD